VKAGEFKNRRKSRGRRGNEAEVFRAKIRLLTSSATILDGTHFAVKGALVLSG